MALEVAIFFCVSARYRPAGDGPARRAPSSGRGACLERARRELIRHVKKALARGVGVSGDELASIVRMVRSQLDLSVRRMLASAPG